LFLILLGVLYSTGDPSDVNLHITKYTKLAFIPLAITLLQKERWRRYGLNAFALAMGMTLLISMLSLFMEIPFMKGDSGSFKGNHYVLKDHIAQNLMMSFFVLIMLVKGYAESSNGRRLAYWGVALIATPNIMAFVHGRTGYLALVAILAVFVFLQISPRRRWQSLLVFVIATAAFLPFADGFRTRIEVAMKELKTHQPHKVTSVGARIEMAKTSLELIRERPLIG
jgi:O-antigen ligase